MRRIEMLKGLQGRTVLVTGAAGNIGAEAVQRFVAEGCNVVAADLHQGAVDGVASQYGDAVVGVAADVTTAEGATACVDGGSGFGGIDLAFVNAGVECTAAPVLDFDVEDFDRVFAVNVRGAFLTAQALLRHFGATKRHGGILFTASVAGLQGGPTTSIYNASKHAVVGLAKSLALETGALGIRVNVLCPGAVDSRMMRSLEGSIGVASGASPDDIKTGIEAATAVGRYATPEEIAATAAWILSDEVPYCHGETFTVSGGMTA
jgi:NAD(P)-dependent dehydrogenase (short-subunit alcohol dehydrogenase family)